MKSNFRGNISISREEFFKAVKDQIISEDQSNKLWEYFLLISAKSNRMVHFFYYFGATLVISAMTWFMTLGWDYFNGGGLFIIASGYSILFYFSGYFLWHKQSLKIPGGILATMSVCMIPLAIYSIEKYLNIWPLGNPGDYTDFYFRMKGSWLFMEVGTIIIGFIIIRVISFPFLVAPIACSLWFLSMDLTSLFGEWNHKGWVSILFGIGILICSYLTDKRMKIEYAFWGYFFGMISVSIGFFLLPYTSGLSWLIYCVTNMLLMLISIILSRKIIMVFGALGVISYLFHLAYEVFANSLGFPFVLSFLGILVIGLGIYYQKNSISIQNAVLKIVPKNLQKFLPVYQLGEKFHQ